MNKQIDVVGFELEEAVELLLNDYSSVIVKQSGMKLSRNNKYINETQKARVIQQAISKTRQCCLENNRDSIEIVISFF